MCLCALFVNYCVMFVYGVFRSWCVCVCDVFACVACGVLRDVVCVFCVCLGVLLIRLCDEFMFYYAMSHGLCLCCCVCVRVGLNVLVRLFVTYYAIVYDVFVGCLCLRVCLVLLTVIGCRVCELLCDDALWILCVLLWLCVCVVCLCVCL